MAYETIFSELSDIFLLIVRIIVGVVLIYYGWPKIKNLRSNGEDFDKMGLSPGIFWGTIVAFIEFVGGIFIILGIFVWVVAILLVIEMAGGTIWKITKTNKSFTDWSYDLLLLALALVLLAFGAGRFSI